MTAPRQVLPGTTYLLTRRCAQRQFLLRPSPQTNEIVLYVLAVAAQRFGISVHACCVLSNHVHVVLTDPDARLPAFAQYFCALVARAVNASLGRWESFWAPGSYSAVSLTSPEDVIDKIAYVLANPVAARLVRAAREWPGVWSPPEHIGGAPLTVRRPAGFFRSDGYMPETVELAFTLPPGFESADVFQDRLRDALAEAEEISRGEGDEEKKPVLGVGKVLAQRWWARPRGREPRRTLNPRVASRDKWKRIEVLSRMAEFVDRYRAALASLRAGIEGVLFPAGTYWLRVSLGVACAAPS